MVDDLGFKRRMGSIMKQTCLSAPVIGPVHLDFFCLCIFIIVTLNVRDLDEIGIVEKFSSLSNILSNILYF